MSLHCRMFWGPSEKNSKAWSFVEMLFQVNGTDPAIHGAQAVFVFPFRVLKSHCWYLKLTQPVEDGQRPPKVSPEAAPEGKEENGAVLSNHEERSLPTNNGSDEEEANDWGESLGELSGEGVTVPCCHCWMHRLLVKHTGLMDLTSL